LKENSNDFILFKSRFLEQDAKNDPVQRVRVLKDIVQTLSKVPDPLARSTYIRECSRILSIEEQILVNETNKLIKNEIRQKRFREQVQANRNADLIIEKEQSTPRTASKQEITYTVGTDLYLEKELIRILINHADKVYDEDSNKRVVDYLVEECEELIPYFENDLFNRIFIETVTRSREGDSVSTKYFMHHQDQEIQQLAVDLVSYPYEYAKWSEKGMELQTQKMPDDNYVNEANQLSIRLNYRKMEKIINENLVRLKELDSSSDEYLVTLKVHQKLLEQRKQIAELLNNVIS